MSTTSAFSRWTAERRGSGSAVLLPFLLVGLTAFGGPLEEPKAPRSIVRILKHQTVPLQLAGKILPGTQVDELEVYGGVVVDARGLVPVLVKEPWSLLHPDGIHFVAEDADGTRYPAELLGIDERLFLAVLKVDALRNRGATLGASLKQEKIHFFKPAGPGWHSETAHVVDALPVRHSAEQELRVCGHIEETRLASENGKGGLLWDERGRFLGVVSERLGSDSSGLRFLVIPAATIRNSVLEIAESRTNLRAGFLGIRGEEDDGGVRVTNVYDDTAAWNSGIMPGDLIVEFEGQPVKSWPELVSQVRWRGPNATVKLRVDRHGREQTFRPQLGVQTTGLQPQKYWVIEVPKVWEGDGSQLKLRPEIKAQLADPGFVLEPMTPQLARKLNAPRHGLFVWEVTPGSLAMKEGFEATDVLCEINGETLYTAEDLKRLFHSAPDGVLEIKYIRDGKRHTKRIRLH